MRLSAYCPDIPQNLGGMIRTCACFGVPLDVIEPCGFPFSIKALRRSAMDYADIADVTQHRDWEAFDASLGSRRLVLLSTRAKASIWEFGFDRNDTILVGQESAGVPDFVRNRADMALSLPMPGGGRSLNVTVSAAITLSEALRQVGHWTP